LNAPFAGDPPTVDATACIDSRPMSGPQRLVAVLCGLALFVDGYDLQALALAVPSLIQQWHLPASHFGVALSAATIGLAAGAALLAPLGDRFGRRIALFAALVLIGAATLATATSTSPTQFVIWRLLTGVGMGICIPNANAWTAEYTPLAHRSLVLVLMNAAVGVGAFSAAFLAPVIINALGWRGTFLIGGVAATVLALAVLTAPESLKFLVARRPRDPRIRHVLRRIAPDVAWESVDVSKQVASPGAPGRSVLELLGKHYRSRTASLWTVVALNLFVLYFLMNWLPTLLQAAGWSRDTALRGTSLIQAGGVIGGILLSFFLDGGKTLPALRVAFILAAICLTLFLLIPSGPGWNVLLLVIGGGVSGAQLALNALSTAYYPPAIKATGMSWVGVVGGMGSIVGPLAGASIIDANYATVDILAVLAVPLLLCAGISLVMQREWQAH
jgi:AAHS family 4-hydroxybenzoate transporter-like MFS transporter